MMCDAPITYCKVGTELEQVSFHVTGNHSSGVLSELDEQIPYAYL